MSTSGVLRSRCACWKAPEAWSSITCIASLRRADRTHPAAFREFVRLRGHTEGVLFDASDSHGQSIYTNVMMSIGTHFAVVCSDCIAPTHRDYVVQRLADTREVFSISMDQMEKGFRGNILKLQSQDGEPLIAMSSRAYERFGEDGKFLYGLGHWCTPI